MADFTININAELVPVYTPIVSLRNYDLCSGIIDNTYSTSLVEGTPTDLHIPLLNTYTGVALKTLHITPVVVRDPTEFYIVYNAIALNTIGVTTNIDITGLATTDTIPLLTFELNPLASYSSGLVFDVEITDINDVRYPAVRSKFIASVDECPEPEEPVFSNDAIVAPTLCDFGQNKAWQLDAPAYSPIHMRYTVIDSGNHGFTGVWDETDTYDGIYIGNITGLTGSTGYTKDIYTNMGALTTRYFIACIQARPPIIASPNTCTVQIALRNNDDAANLQIITITDTETP